jgi:lycopene cyclase domain-containing protein
MTYFGFLAIFLGIPIAILSIWTIRDYNNKTWLPQSLLLWNPLAVLISLCVVAFLYTTPWDNYLVATNVWWYDIDLVSGIVFGYVPIEEYTFFIVQPIMTGLLLFTLARYIKPDALAADSVKIRQIGTGVVAFIWLVSVVLLILTFVSDQWDAFTYLSLELSWALIPVMIQMAFGADILWRHRKIIILSILISTVYLSGADAIAIGSGTWTIDPQQSLNVFIGGVLPIEEFVFFLLTNTLVAMGLVLVLAQESLQRAMKIVVLRPLLRLNAQYARLETV